ncbi:hypothetical protein HZC32_02665 [Candidatus Woesearchaeota archaeon]|nr:hypothetical protein [Candidatus Woesearchaeota archaeon]
MRLNQKRIEEVIHSILGEEGKSLIKELRELFFACKNNCVRLNFDQAMDFEFHCPECGELVSQDQGEEAKQIKKKIAEMEEELSSVERKERRRPTTKDKKSVAHKKKLSLRKNKLKKREKG